jgi:thiamine biosynthesis protein ThiS
LASGLNGSKFDYSGLKSGVSTNVPIEIVVNGEKRIAHEGQTILGLLQELGLEPARVAVEYDRRIVKQVLWQETVLRPGSQLEIVQFVGGG